MTITSVHQILAAVGARNGGHRPKDAQYTAELDINGDGVISLKDVGAYLALNPLDVSLLEQAIADRGNHALPHEILLPDPPASWSWGAHAQEAGRSGIGSLNLWIVAEPDRSNIGITWDARLAIKECHMYWLVGTTWNTWNGTPGFGSFQESSNYETNGSYSDVSKVVEGDGAWSYALPANKALHHSQSSPGVLVPTQATAVLCIAKAKLVGADAADSGLKWGMNVGADWKAKDGSCAAICGAAGLGRFLRMTDQYRWVTMLSSIQSDGIIRANPPTLPS